MKSLKNGVVWLMLAAGGLFASSAWAQEAEEAMQVAASDGGGMGFIGTLIWLGVMVAVIAGVWKVFTKAGKPGWAALVPIYNIVVWMQIVGRPLWWIILLFIPLANFIVLIILSLDLAKRFGKGAGFGIGIAFLGFIFIPILGFGDAQYTPPEGAPAA